MEVILLRSAVIRIGSDGRPFRVHSQLGEVEVYSTSAVSIDGKYAGVVVVAAVLTNILIAEQQSTIPEDARNKAEQAIETVARLCAIDRQTTHAISSPMPFIGFQTTSSEQLPLLENVAFDAQLLAMHQGASFSTSALAEVNLELISDRLDGVALLAEALNSTTPLGKYMQLMRLFERGFKLGPGGLTEPLINFLGESDYGFSADEIRAWTSARGPSAHADLREEFYLDADVRPLVDRMLYAGYEILFNKETWRSRTHSRRNIWTPSVGTRGHGNNLFITQGHNVGITIQLLDGFKSYPAMLAGPIESLLPAAAWLLANKNEAILRLVGSFNVDSNTP